MGRVLGSVVNQSTEQDLAERRRRKLQYEMDVGAHFDATGGAAQRAESVVDRLLESAVSYMGVFDERDMQEPSDVSSSVEADLMLCRTQQEMGRYGEDSVDYESLTIDQRIAVEAIKAQVMETRSRCILDVARMMLRAELGFTS